MIEIRQNADEAAGQIVTNVMYELHKPFIRKILSRRFPSFLPSYRAEIEQAAAVGFMCALNRLKPDYLLITYMEPFILHSVTDFISLEINRNTSYVSAQIQKIIRAEAALERKGISRPDTCLTRPKPACPP